MGFAGIMRSATLDAINHGTHATYVTAHTIVEPSSRVTFVNNTTSSGHRGIPDLSTERMRKVSSGFRN
jgi:hypothetical protein